MAVSLSDGVVIEVKIDPSIMVTPQITLPYPGIEVLPMVGLQGPKGDKGEDAHMRGPRGHIQHVGDGAPGVIVGAEPGDTYLDRSTGTIWTLE